MRQLPARLKEPANFLTITAMVFMLASILSVTRYGASDFRAQGFILLLGAGIAYAYTTEMFTSAIVLLVALIALVPIYWIPEPGAVPFTLVPAAFAGLLLAPVAISKIGIGKLVTLDYIIAGTVFTGVITNYLNYDYALNFSIGLIIRVGLVYLAFRLIAQRINLLRAVTVTMFTCGAVLSVAALYERMTATNIFLEVREPGYQADLWAKIFIRFGEVRAATSFGQPIPLGLFFATCVILGAGLYLSTESRRAHFWLAWGEVLLVVGLYATLTRAPLAVAAIGYVVFALRTKSIDKYKQLIVGSVVAGVVAAFTPLGTQLSALWDNTFGASTDKLTASSTDYRGSLFTAFTRTENYSFFGIARGNLYDQSQVVGVSGSVDNEFLLRLFQYGTVGLLLFAGLVAVLVWAVLGETDPIRLAWTISTAAVAVSLLTVALLLQQGDFFWIGVGVTAGCIAVRQQSVAVPPAAIRVRATR